jgi:hypothetical protein
MAQINTPTEEITTTNTTALPAAVTSLAKPSVTDLLPSLHGARPRCC